jgi:hypothetical protein
MRWRGIIFGLLLVLVTVGVASAEQVQCVKLSNGLLRCMRPSGTTDCVLTNRGTVICNDTNYYNPYSVPQSNFDPPPPSSNWLQTPPDPRDRRPQGLPQFPM